MTHSWKVKKENNGLQRKTGTPLWKKKGIWFSMLIVVIILGLIFFLIQKSKKNQLENSTKSVKSAQVELGNISENVDGSGVLSAAGTVSIKLPVGIVVEKIYVESGDAVKAGDSLAKIKEVSIVGALVDVEESIDRIDDQLEDDDDLTDLEIQKLQLQKNELKEEKEKLNKYKKNPTVKATCDGIIGDINVSEGNETNQNSGSGSSVTTQSSSNMMASYQSATVMTVSGVAQGRFMIANLTPTTGMVTYVSNIENNSSGINLASEGTTEQREETVAETTTEKEDDTASEATTEKKEDSAPEATTEKKEDVTSVATTEENSKENQQNMQQNSAATNQTNSTQQTTQKSMNQQTTSGVKQSGSISTGGTNTEQATNNSNSEIYSAYEMCGFTIISLDKVKVSISVDELDILSVEKGQTASITLDAVSDQEFEGTITKVSTMSSSESGNSKYTVEIELPMTKDMLLGMTASAVIHINQAIDVPVIPMIALQQEGGKTYVYTASDDKGNLSGKTEVTTGISDGSNIQVVDGLKEGDTVYYTRSVNSDSESNKNFKGGMPGGDLPDEKLGFGNWQNREKTGGNSGNYENRQKGN